MDPAVRELQGAIKDLARRVEELEKWGETFRNCIEAGTQTTTTHQERHEVLNDRLDTLSARVALLQPRQPNMVECPACRDGLVSSTGDADDPPSHDRCELCNGVGEVPEGVAAYVRKLERRLRVLGLQGRGWQESAIYWRKRCKEEVARDEKDSQTTAVDASGKGGTGAGMGESMGRES